LKKYGWASLLNDPASRILYCDAACVVVNKIAGEAVEGAGKNMADLPSLLAACLAAPEHPSAQPAENALPLPRAVHRIDVPVSGCALFARTGAALCFLSEQFRSNGIVKRYWAIVEPPESKAPHALAFLESCVAGDNSELVHWVRFDPRKNKSFAYNEPGPGRNAGSGHPGALKKAVLRCGRAEKGEKYFVLEIDLITGRHHQIRAQLERMGLHIKGDLKYGARRSEKNGGIRLHSRLLSFPDPADSSRRITVQAEPPLQDKLWLAAQTQLLSGGPI
jgi:23S rRNA pseudouridine1911/1915/1917 synthase